MPAERHIRSLGQLMTIPSKARGSHSLHSRPVVKSMCGLRGRCPATSVLHRSSKSMRSIRQIGRNVFRERSGYFVRICVGVLAFSRVKETDTYMLDDALVYWIAEGGTTLRFHAGDCYMRSQRGFPAAPPGSCPCANLFTACGSVEGTFRRMRRTVERNARLEETSHMFATDNHDETTFLEKRIDACLMSQARRRRRRRDDEEGDDALLPWKSVAAKTVIAAEKLLPEDSALHQGRRAGTCRPAAP